MADNPRSAGNVPLEKGGRFCLLCRKPIDGKNPKALYCSEDHRLKAKALKRQKARPFFALDGEGEENRYILLAAKRHGIQPKSVSNRDGLSTKDCLNFLLSLPKGTDGGTKPVYVWFAFDYDVNMILGDLPLKGEENSIEELRRENQTMWEGYKITYIKRKIFRVSKDGRHFHSVDMWSFFAGTFEKALADWDVESSDVISRGKKAREDFSSWSMEEIQEYCFAELDCLSRLAEKLRESVKPLEIRVNSWHGPGAFAGAFLSKLKAAKMVGKISDELYDASSRAYFGGRIDAAGYGFIEPVYHYDLVSAYPSGIRFLPDLSRVTWEHKKGKPPKDHTLYCALVKWEIPASNWGALPWRGRSGIIRYPRQGIGWYWKPELEAAQERFPNSIEIMECFYTTDILTFPFWNVIEEAFAYRKELKEKGDSAHKALKLILNSLYGKFAQTVGRAQYYSPIWAGLITAHTRAEISKVITDDVVCTMTDSIWSKTPLNVPTSGELGEWESQDENSLALAEAGLYEAFTPTGEKTIWQRGFDKRNPVDISNIVDNWLGKNPVYIASYSVKRFVGMGLASVTSNPWRHWVELERKIQPVPIVGTTKRLPLYPLGIHDKTDSEFQFLRLRPADEFVCSYPYSKLTLDKELVISRLTDEVSE